MSDTHFDLASIVLTLRPQKPGILPLGLGRAAQAVLLSWVREIDPALAETLHDDQPIKPYTCSTLRGARGVSGGRIEVDPARAYRLRFTTLSSGLTSLLLDFLNTSAPVIEAPPDVMLSRSSEQSEESAKHPVTSAPTSSLTVELDRHPFTLEGWTIDPAQDPWAGCTTYQDLAAPHLLVQKSPNRYVELEFASPTTFRSGGRNVPAPMPDLVFGSLMDKWNALSPVAVSPDARRYAAECMAVAAYELRSRAWPFKDALIVGGVGRCRYVMINQDRYWMSVIQLLADWALFAGVGAQTASGLGQARRAPEKAGTSQRENKPAPRGRVERGGKDD